MAVDGEAVSVIWKVNFEISSKVWHWYKKSLVYLCKQGVFWYIFIAILYPNLVQFISLLSYTIPHGTLFCTIIHLIIYPCGRWRLPRPYCSVSTSYKNFSFILNYSILFLPRVIKTFTCLIFIQPVQHYWKHLY